MQRLQHSCRTLRKKNQREFLSIPLENTLSPTYFLCGCFLITSKQKQSIQTVLLLGSQPLTKPLELWDGYMTWEGKMCVYRGCRAGKQLSPLNLVQAFSNYTSAQHSKERKYIPTGYMKWAPRSIAASEGGLWNGDYFKRKSDFTYDKGMDMPWWCRKASWITRTHLPPRESKGRASILLTALGRATSTSTHSYPNPESYTGISVVCFWIMVWNKKVVL